MKIVDVQCTVVYARRRRAFGGVVETALGRAAVSEHAVVRLHTDAGITGIGEIASVFEKRGGVLSEELMSTLAPVLVDADPFAINALHAAMDACLPGSEPAKAAVGMALYDIVGKALDVPAHALLGGKVRERVPLSYSIPFGTPDQMAEFGAARVAEGFKTVKVKIGQSHERDVEAVKRVREAVGGEVIVRVDANMAFDSVDRAVRTIRAIEPYDPELIEQPLKPDRLDEMAEIRTRVRVPIMADESIWSPATAMQVVRKGAADIANVYVAEAGGLKPAADIFTLCELAEMPCMIGSMPELGIGTAAQIHLGVAMRNLKLDSDCCGSLYHVDDVLGSSLDIAQGYAAPPPGAGLGVELDESAVARLRTPPSAEDSP